MNFNSIRVRLIASALLMIIITLPIIGIALNKAFEVHLKNALQQELSANIYSILATADVDNGELFMPEQLLENKFNVSQSGLYGIISSPKSASNIPKILWKSESLLSLDIPTELNHPIQGQFDFYTIKLDDTDHAVYSYSVSFVENNAEFPFTVHVIEDLNDFMLVTQSFRTQIWGWLFALMGFFLVVQAVWLTWSLKPLRQLKQELNKIEQGKALTVSENYPKELSLVTQQLNNLLKTEQSQRTRYRNALSDLAHSLKAPLAVIQSQGDLSTTSLEQLQTLNHMIEHQLKRAQAAGESSWYLGVPVVPVAEKLTNTMAKLYRDNRITLHHQLTEADIFKGDEVDLMEILGNLLDNACKAAKHNVSLTLTGQNNTLTITVEDDGEGIEDSVKASIMTRGTRADTYSQGHGIGLAIVRDLVESYQGTIAIDRSDKLGGAKFTLSFN